MKPIIEMDTVRMSPADLSGVVVSLLGKVGVPTEDAGVVADVMVNADMKGVESHGVRWLDIYLKRIQAGCVMPETKLEVVREKAGFLVLNANSGLGQVAMAKATVMGIAKAKEAGTCVVAVGKSNHFGTAGYYTELAAKSDIASIVMTNGTPLMAPWGGMTPCIGTNPVSFGFPTSDIPVVVDMATSAAARGKVFVAAQKGTKLEPGLALNKNGEPTVDPKEALEGLLLPVGGPKGYGLSLIIDIMAGVMTGSNFGQNIGSLYGDFSRPQDIGHFALFINVDDFLPLDEYKARMEKSRNELKSSKLAKGFNEIFVPGEIEANAYRQKAASGVTIPLSTWNTLQSWMTKFGLS